MPSGRSNAREALFPQRWLRFTRELRRILSAWLLYPRQRQSVSDQVRCGCTEWDRSLRTQQNCLFRWNTLLIATMPKQIYKTHGICWSAFVRSPEKRSRLTAQLPKAQSRPILPFSCHASDHSTSLCDCCDPQKTANLSAGQFWSPTQVVEDRYLPSFRLETVFSYSDIASLPNIVPLQPLQTL